MEKDGEMKITETGKSLIDRVAVVTGAGRGIGRAHALRLASEGAKVVVNDLGGELAGGGSDSTPAETVVSEIRALGGVAVANADSVSTMEGGRHIIEAALDSFGRIDILINNAGIARGNLLFDVTEEYFDLAIGVHIKGTFSMTYHVAPHFRAQRSGVIINTGSVAGLGIYGNSIYATAKEAIAGFTRSIAREVGPYNVRCNLIRPAAMTRMAADNKSDISKKLTYEAEQKYGFPSVGDIWATKKYSSPGAAPDMSADHIADFAAWLCTDEAAHINGEDFMVMAGEIALMSAPHVIRSSFREGRWDLASLNANYIHKDLKNRFLPQKGVI